MMDSLGMTSRLVAAAREVESQRPDRLFNDPFAGLLAGDAPC
jgi:O-methyltransferase involved in polyketide biosynthesis